MLLALVVVCDQRDVPPAVIGLLLAGFSGCILLGSLLSGVVRWWLSARTSMLLELAAWPVPLLYALWPHPYVLAACLIPVGLAIPVTDAVVVAYRYAATPGHLVGRVESVRSTLALALTPFGALLAGLLLDAAPARVAVPVLRLPSVPVLVWAVLSPALRHPPEPAGAA